MTLPFNAANDSFLPARAVWERYGVTYMSLYRWVNDEDMGFPKPVYIGRYRYWKLADLRAWENSRPKGGDRVGPYPRREEAAGASVDAA